METLPVLICGAGPTGLHLALQLLQYDVPFRLIDQAHEISPTSRAIIVQARTLELYDRLGIIDTVLQHGLRVNGFVAACPGDPKDRGGNDFEAFGKGLTKFNHVLSLSQDEHERILCDTVVKRGGKIERGVELMDVQEEEEGGVCVKTKCIEDGTVEEGMYSYVAGCDGGHSAVRRRIGVPMTGGTYDNRFFVVDVIGTTPLHDKTSKVCLNVTSKDFVLSIPQQGGRLRLIGFVPADNTKSDKDVTLDDCRPTIDRTIDLDIQEERWFTVYRSHHRVADRFRQGRIFLLGDAAHLHSPVGGQGMNLGIGDAENLGWKLATVFRNKIDPIDQEALLDSYEKERRALAAEIVASTDNAFSNFVDPGWTGWFLRIAVIPYIFPAITRYLGSYVGPTIFLRVSQLAIQYNSVLNGGPGAGKAFPRVLGVTLNSAEKTTSKGWEIHHFGDRGSWSRVLTEGERSRFRVISHDWKEEARILGLKENKVYIVRPDGYVGSVTDQDDEEGVKRYLSRWVKW